MAINTRKDKLTPRAKYWLDQAMDILDDDRAKGKRDIAAKLADLIWADPLRFIGELERREQAAGAPAAALGGPSIDIKQLWLTAVQARPEPKTIEGRATGPDDPGTERVSEPASHWDH